MNVEAGETSKPKTLAFECDSCGQAFESWERLRQHQVDCQTESFDSEF